MNPMTSGGTIPKVIHYIWVGPNKLSPLTERCIQSWKTYAPEYAVRFWNEENSPMDHPYVREMYRKGKWAFVSDYIRFWVLEQEGGIYLDTDMELLKPIDQFLEDNAFFGKTKDGYIACGIIGAIPHHPAIQSILNFYDTDSSFSTEHTSPKVVTRILTAQNREDVTTYDPSYFYPLNDGERRTPESLEGAYATHHWAESWVSFAGVRKVLRRVGVMPFLKRILGKGV